MGTGSRHAFHVEDLKTLVIAYEKHEDRPTYRLAQSRIAVTWRTIRQAVRYRVSTALSRPRKLSGRDGEILGYIDRIVLRDGQMRVEGWSAVRGLRLSTELQSVNISADLPRTDATLVADAGGFDTTMSGIQFLRISDGERDLANLALVGHAQLAAAWIRTLWLLVCLPLSHWRAIRAWLLEGDSASGTELERVLLPRPPVPTLPTAHPNIFFSDGGAISRDVGPVDILLPVYNAFDDLRDCLRRLELHTSLRHRIIIIDDASTDARVAPELAHFAKRRANVEIERKTANTGFIASVNLGLARARGHVILLNSDALVSADWLERLVAPIVADQMIATVTPMTNNGEIASVPVICRHSDLRHGDVDAIAAAAAHLDPLRAIAEAPTGVGFCMAMSRRWLDLVPTFDPAFGRGYGEEVDWCQRVSSHGARHVLTGAVFVEHRGGRSFGDEKLLRVAQNNARVSRRYPAYDAAVQAFLTGDPAVGSRLALGLAAAGRGPRALAIYLAHRLGGGAEHWLSDEVDTAITAGNSVAIIRDGDPPDTLLLELHCPNGVTKGNVRVDELANYLGLVERKRLIYSNLVGARDPLRLLGQTASTLNPQDELNVVFHDYFPLCPSYTLIGVEGQFCGLPEETTCQTCYLKLARVTGTRPQTISQWRSEWYSHLSRADRIEVFSQSSFDYVSQIWPDLEDKIQIKPHRMNVLPELIDPPRNTVPVVGVLGAIGYEKGAAVLHEIAETAGGRLEIVVIGKMDPAFFHPKIKVHGPYARTEIASLARFYKIDRWLLPSIWPETYSFTIRECLATGLPVYSLDLGAQAEAAKSAPNGICIPSTAVSSLAETLAAPLPTPSKPAMTVVRNVEVVNG